MDAVFLNFHKEEDFSSYFSDQCEEDSQSYDGVQNENVDYHWMDYERELNGDMGLIPTASESAVTLCTSPPLKEDFNKIMNDWNHLVSLEVGNELVADLAAVELSAPEVKTVPVHDEEDALNITAEGFDIAQYIADVPEVATSSNLSSAQHQQILKVKTEEDAVQVAAVARPPPKFGGKRIDMARGRYMVDEEEEEEESEDDEDIAVDVETVEGEGEVSHPVLQAGDLDSLLEQFEATETTNMVLQQQVGTPERDVKSDISLDIFVEQVKLISPIKSPMVTKNMKRTKGNRHSLDFREASVKPETSPVKDQRKNKLILEALPTELIDRIRASSKRKPVPVIEPIAPAPIKRRMLSSQHPIKDVKDPITNSTLAQRIINHNCNSNSNSNNNNNKMSTAVTHKQVMLDHDYCSYALPNSAKDSGFSSAEEDEKTIIRTQPTIKCSDGKLMVSLLKTNTIKKKLNLEEYKKRLQNRSGGNSPAADDDENARRLKHTEMLMKMAQDHLKQEAESSSPSIKIPEVIALVTPGTPVTPVNPVKGVTHCDTLLPNVDGVKIKQEVEEIKVQIVEVKKPPKNIIMKTLVTMGTNTEESWGHLEQIFQNTHLKISPNSLISSIVEQLPKPKPIVPDEQVEHGEDKTIVFVDTTRLKMETCNVSVQTLHSSSSLLRQQRRGRRRRRRRSSSSSSGSTASSASYSDNDSYTESESDSDSDSDSARGRSRSRTPSPVRRKNQQQSKEVEERRVVYVGRIPDGFTKDDLRRRFARFGHITNLSLHFRRNADNYGFVTFVRKEDAYQAVERGNEDPSEPAYDLSFGGRRLFCQTSYADLDNVHDEELYEEYWLPPGMEHASVGDRNSFDSLLRKAQAKLRHRKL